MPIYSSPEKKLNILFLHVPKCGGGSIEKFFRDNGFVEEFRCIDRRLLGLYRCSPQHWHRPMLESVLKMDSFDYIFSVVRDPVARLVSEYKWRLAHPLAADGIDVWYERVRGSFLKDPYFFDNHLRAQVEFLVPSARVFRLEGSLQAVVDRIALDLGLDFQLPIIPNQKSGVHRKRLAADPELVKRDALSAPSASTIDLIRRDYALDYQFLARYESESVVICGA